MKSNKGITLVALVVTMAVLVILAGVSLSMVGGKNGIVTRAQDASAQAINQQIYSETKLNEVASGMTNTEKGTDRPTELNGIRINSMTIPENEITTTSITIYVNASADNGIAKIEYSKDGVNYVTDTNQTATSYTFSGLTTNTTYKMRVKVSDGKGNVAIYPSNVEVKTK